MIVETFLPQEVHKFRIFNFKGIEYLQINIIIIYHHTILIIEIAETILLLKIFNSPQLGNIRPRELNNTHLINFQSLDMIIWVKTIIYLIKHQIQSKIYYKMLTITIEKHCFYISSTSIITTIKNSVWISTSCEEDLNIVLPFQCILFQLTWVIIMRR